MQIIQRIGLDPKEAELMFYALEKHPNSFTDVWLNTAYGYPKNETHFRAADYYAELAEKFRAAGIGVSLQLSNTIGHGTYMSCLDCSGLVYEGSKVRKIVGHDGKVCEFGFCWNDRLFRDYILEHVRYYVAKVQPLRFWIDDDFRTNNHAPVSFGCFCDDCMARFNATLGTNFTREELIEEYLHGDIAVREAFINFIRSNMADFMEEICRAVHENCAETAVCFQNGANGLFTGPDLAHLFDVMLKTTGHAPQYRAGGGASFDHNPNEITEKIIALDWQHSKLPPYVEHKCPEIENTPNTVIGKTMRGSAFEATLNFASGATDISYAMIGQIPESFEFYEKGFAMFSNLRPYWEKLAEVSMRTSHGGLTYANSKEAHLRPLDEKDDMYSFNREPFDSAKAMTRWGATISFAERENGLFLLHPDAARQMSQAELISLMSKPVITDGETVEYLKSKGIDLGVEVRPLSELEVLRSKEIFTDHAVNAVGAGSFTSPFFSPGASNHYALTKLPENAEKLGYYAENESSSARECTNAIITTPKGGRWAIIGYSLWKYLISSAQRDRVWNIADYIAPQALAAKMVSPVQSFLRARVDKVSGKTAAVSHLNPTVEDQTDVKIAIRNPETENFRFISELNGECDLPFEKIGEDYIVTMPKVSPWSVATVFCV